MEVKEAYEKLMESEIFKNWEKKDKTHWSHAFIMPSVPEWQLGFYDPEEDKVTTFFIKQKIEKSPQTDIMKKNHIVKSLKIEDVKFEFTQALEKANELIGEESDLGKVNKEIVILQNNVEEGQVWNITLLTESFKVANYKISSIDGKVKDKRIQSVFDFKQ